MCAYTLAPVGGKAFNESVSQIEPCTRLFLGKENPHSREYAPPVSRAAYTVARLERLGPWQFPTGGSCEPGVVCFGPTSLERILRQGPGLGR